MIFNSIAFLVFFFLVTIVFFILPHRLRNGWLLISSCYFYMYSVPPYILILLAMITWDYGAAIWISRTFGIWRKVALLTSLIGNGTLLFLFKYMNFFNDSISFVLKEFHLQTHLPHVNWLLPIGLSFHTLQSVAYTIDVYRKSVKPEKNYLVYALFVMFYPQMVAGPIERAANMLPQFRQKHELQWRNLVEGGRLILWGFFQKVVIADRLSIVVDHVFEHPGSHHAAEIWIAIVFLLVQVYCDFCGYSDIARGCAQVMGFKLSLNFNNPLAARSLIEFWSRWHLSLVSWIRTYLFFPMMRSRLFGSWIAFNVIFMFVFSGLWHGAKWTFVFWGLLNGLIYLVQRKLRYLSDHKFKYVNIASNLLLMSVIGIFFRAVSLDNGFDVLKQLIGVGGMPDPDSISGMTERLGVGSFNLIVDLFLAAGILSLQIALDVKGKNYSELVLIPDRQPRWSRLALYYTLIFGILLLGQFSGSPFVYFQF